AVLGGELVGDLARAVRAVVVHHQHVGIRHGTADPARRRFEVGALVVGGHDHGNAPRGLLAALRTTQDSLPARCLSPRGARASPSPRRWTSLQVTVWRRQRCPAGVLAAEGTRLRKARAALRTGVHPVGHETGPVVY